jgi:hypothetical protein
VCELFCKAAARLGAPFILDRDESAVLAKAKLVNKDVDGILGELATRSPSLSYTWEEKFEEAWAEVKEEFSIGAQADGVAATTKTESVGAGVEGKRASEGSTKLARTNKVTDVATKGEKAAMSKLLADATKHLVEGHIADG